MSDTLPVIFRTYRGQVTAYFPTEAWAPGQITCYAHIGQHGGADRSWLQRGRPSTPEELAPLLAELTGLYGSDPDPVALRVYRRDPSRALGARHA